jgi:hypothetical protein
MTLEAQFIQALSALVYIVAIAGITYVTPKIKQFLEVHTNAKTASTVTDEFSTIAESVVNDFNNRIVNDAKARQAWNPQLAQTIKNDAIASVKTQIEPLLSTLIEQAVSKAKEVK